MSCFRSCESDKVMNKLLLSLELFPFFLFSEFRDENNPNNFINKRIFHRFFNKYEIFSWSFCSTPPPPSHEIYFNALAIRTLFFTSKSHRLLNVKTLTQCLSYVKTLFSQPPACSCFSFKDFLEFFSDFKMHASTLVWEHEKKSGRKNW